MAQHLQVQQPEYQGAASALFKLKSYLGTKLHVLIQHNFYVIKVGSAAIT
jgi:hypothetical protein